MAGHKSLADAELHLCKGMAAATAGAFVVADGAGSQGTTVSNPASMYDQELRRAYLVDYAEKVNAAGNITGATAINYETANVYTATLTGNVTFSITNPPATGRLGSITLILTQDGTGSRTITWPTTTKWAGGAAPAITPTAAAIDIISLFTVNGGTTWYGFTGGLAFS